MPKQTFPQWATPERRARLVTLLVQSGGLCVFNGKGCAHHDGDGCGNADHVVGACARPLQHLYEFYQEDLIEGWKADDREERAYLRSLSERGTLRLVELGRWGSRFDPVARDRFMESRPAFYIDGYTYDFARRSPVAIVRPAGTGVRLHVLVPAPFRRMGKNRRRKATRYAKQPPQETMKAIESLCSSAVAHWRLLH